MQEQWETGINNKETERQANKQTERQTNKT